MPLLLLLVAAAASGLAVFLVARLYPRHPGPPQVLEAAREAGRHATGPAARRAIRSARLDPEKATGLALTLAIAVIFLGGLVLATMAAIVRSDDFLSGLDTGAAAWGDRHATAWTDDAITLITNLGGTWTVILLAALVAAIDLARTRNRWVVPFLFAVLAGGTLITEAIKGLVDRARPELEPVAATLGPSFPSGHSATAAAAWAAFALIAGRWLGPRAWPALAATAVGVAVAVAVSRVLLDVHWLTDVIAGLALGWAWFAVCAIAFGGRVLRFGAAARAAGRGEIEARTATDPNRA